MQVRFSGDRDWGLSAVHHLFGPHVDLDAVGRAVGGLPGSDVALSATNRMRSPTDPTGPAVKGVWASTVHPHLTATRFFHRDAAGDLVVHHLMQEASKEIRGGGHHRFRAVLDALRGLGVRHVYATSEGRHGDPHYSGYYVWPRYGFSGAVSDRNLERLSPPVRSRLVESVGDRRPTFHDLFALPGGSDDWFRNGGPAHLYFDTDPASPHSAAFEAYYRERLSRPAHAGAGPTPGATGDPAGGSGRVPGTAGPGTPGGGSPTAPGRPGTAAEDRLDRVTRGLRRLSRRLRYNRVGVPPLPPDSPEYAAVVAQRRRRVRDAMRRLREQRSAADPAANADLLVAHVTTHGPANRGHLQSRLRLTAPALDAAVAAAGSRLRAETRPAHPNGGGPAATWYHPAETATAADRPRGYARDYGRVVRYSAFSPLCRHCGAACTSPTETPDGTPVCEHCSTACDSCGDFHLDAAENLTPTRHGDDDYRPVCESCRENANAFPACAACSEPTADDDLATVQGGGRVCGGCWTNYSTCDDCDEDVPTADVRSAYRFRRGRSRQVDVCEHCLDDHYRSCPDCDDFTHEDDLTGENAAGDAVCPACNANYSRCAECDAVTPNDDMHDDVCEDCAETAEEAEQNSRLIYPSSYEPDAWIHHGTGRHYGVELETVLKSGDLHTAATTVLDRLNRGLGREGFAFLKEDGSLSGGVGSFEIVTHPATLDVHRDRWPAVLGDNAPAGLVSHDAPCEAGMHVHVERRGLSELAVGKVLAFVNAAANRPLVEAVARRSSDRYARLDPTKTVATGRLKNPSRYEAVNLQNDDTLEFRIFKGTLKPESFFRSLEFCDAVVEFCRPAAGASVADVVGPDRFAEFVARNRRRYQHLYPFVEQFFGRTPPARKVYARDSDPTPSGYPPVRMSVTLQFRRRPPDALARFRRRLRDGLRRLARPRESGFLDALRRVRSSQQERVRKIADYVLRAVGLEPASVRDCIHDAGHAAINGAAAATYHDGDPATARYAAAWYGLLTQSPAVAVFHVGEGSSKLWKAKATGTGDAVRESLARHGIASRHLIPTDAGFDVLVLDPGARLGDAVRGFAAEHGSQVWESSGTVDVLGGTGGGARAGSQARDSYRDAIAAYEHRGDRP